MGFESQCLKLFLYSPDIHSSIASSVWDRVHVTTLYKWLMNISLEIQTKTWVLHRIATSLWTLKSTWAELSWEPSLLCCKQGWRRKDKNHETLVTTPPPVFLFTLSLFRPLSQKKWCSFPSSIWNLINNFIFSIEETFRFMQDKYLKILVLS